MNDATALDEQLRADEAWREMRLHMEWNEALSLCFLFAPDTRAVADIRQWASDNFAYRTAPLLVVEPHQPANASADVLLSLQQHVHNLSMVRAPVWLQMLAVDDTSQTGWDSSRAELLSRLNEAREWLVKSFARPLVVCLPPSWRHRVVALAPDLWHIRSYSVLLAPVVDTAPDRSTVGNESHVLPPVTERELAAAQPSLEAARARQLQRPQDPALQRELSMALDDWGDANLDAGRASEALAAYRESLQLCRQLRQSLGDSPQVLRDLSVSLNKVGAAEDTAGRASEALAAYRESLQLRRQLRQSLGDSPQVLDDLAVSLERMAELRKQDQHNQIAEIDEAVALRQQLVAASNGSAYHQQRLATAMSLAQQLADQRVTASTPHPSAAKTAD